ncbi:hypothetical protein BD779DRAFT_1677407 [Infundibulicybe gibba]|nr:hypothetical protein BD779DRAFT_1677407 [Infundibulicybe gibba]
MTSRRGEPVPGPSDRAGVTRTPSQAPATPTTASKPFPTTPAERTASREASRERARTKKFDIDDPDSDKEEQVSLGSRSPRRSTSAPAGDRRSPVPAASASGGDGGDKDAEMPDAPGETSESSARKSTFIGLDNDDHGIAIAEVVLDAFTDITKFFAVNDYLSNDTDGGGIPPDKVKMLGITALGAIRAIETRMGFTVKELAETEADDTITSPAAAAALRAPTAGPSHQATRAPPPIFTPPAPRPDLDARIEGSLARRVAGAEQLPTAPSRGRKRTRKRKPKERDPNAPPPAPLSYAQTIAQAAARSCPRVNAQIQTRATTPMRSGASTPAPILTDEELRASMPNLTTGQLEAVRRALYEPPRSGPLPARRNGSARQVLFSYGGHAPSPITRPNMARMKEDIDTALVGRSIPPSSRRL